MSKFKVFLFLQFLFFFSLPVLAQVYEAWVARYSGPEGNSADVATVLAVDGSGNVYVTGLSESGPFSFYDYATIKYKPNGDTAWVRRYDGPNNSWDEATALAVDGSGNVCVTGFSDGGVSSADYATIKYAPNGDTLWLRRFNGLANSGDYATALAVDGSGNIYVTGRSESGPPSYGDYVTIKYAPNGDTAWVRWYDGPTPSDDYANALAVDGFGNVYVTGYNVDTLSLSDYATIKYSSDGNTAWVKRYDGTGNDIDQATALAVDDSGNVYVAGTSIGSGSAADYATIKYYPNGDTAWIRRYNGLYNGADQVAGLAVDGSGNVYVTGLSDGGPFSDYDYATIKYYPNGDTAWVRRYDGPGGGSFDYAQAVAVDSFGNVYVTGSSPYINNYDYTTIKYAPCSAKPGDANGDGSVTLPDIIYVVNRVFKGGPAPSPLCRGDANGDSNVTLPDIVYLVNRIFKGGPAPIKIGVCCL